MSLLAYAEIFFHEGNPVNRRFNDIYYHAAQGFAESDHVFIHGNRLLERFHALSDGQDFTIGEIGFGTGLNLLNASRHFLDLAPERSRLYLISCEKHPIPLTLLRAIHQDWPLLAWRDALYRQYPGNHRGIHFLRLHPRIDLQLLMCAAGAEKLAAFAELLDSRFFQQRIADSRPSASVRQAATTCRFAARFRARKASPSATRRGVSTPASRSTSHSRFIAAYTCTPVSARKARSPRFSVPN